MPYKLVSFFFSCSSTMASCAEQHFVSFGQSERWSLTKAVLCVQEGELFILVGIVVEVSLCISDPDVIDDCGSFALCSFWVSYQVIPSTEHPPAKCEVLIGGTCQAQARVLGHSAEQSFRISYYELGVEQSNTSWCEYMCRYLWCLKISNRLGVKKIRLHHSIPVCAEIRSWTENSDYFLSRMMKL